MSNWTYINGAIVLGTSPLVNKYTEDGKYAYYTSGEFEDYVISEIPYPDEQVSLGNVNAIVRPGINKHEPVICYDMTITAYPIIKHAVSKYITEIPAGEYEVIEWSLTDLHCGGSSGNAFMCEAEKEVFYNKVMQIDGLNHFDTVEDLLNYKPVEPDWIHHEEESNLTIAAPTRSHDADEIFVKFMSFVQNLLYEDIIFEDGVITIKDYNTRYTLIFNSNQTIEVTKLITYYNYDGGPDTTSTETSYYSVEESVKEALKAHRPIKYKLAIMG